MQLPRWSGGKLEKIAEMVTFGGLNWTNDYSDGELASCDRISDGTFPYLETAGDIVSRNTHVDIVGVTFYKGDRIDVHADGRIFIAGEEQTLVDHEGKTTSCIFFDGEGRDQVSLEIVNNYLFYNDDYSLDLDTKVLRLMRGSYHFSISHPDERTTLTHREINGVKLENVMDGGRWENYKEGMYVPKEERDTFYEFLHRGALSRMGTDFSKIFPKGTEVDIKGDVVPEKTLTVKEATRGKITFDTEILPEVLPEGGQQWGPSGYNMDVSPFEDPVISDGNVTIEFDRVMFSAYTVRSNRLWGSSDEENVIYASSLGDFFNMRQYEGVSTDAYAVAVASDGGFTGACALSDSVVFFKRDRIYKIVGEYPAEYQLYELIAPGVRDNAKNSVVVIEDRVYYLGERGVYEYSGGAYPVSISSKLGDHGPFSGELTHVFAWQAGRRYCLCGTDSTGTWLYRYNLDRGVWVREQLQDSIRAGISYGESLSLFTQGQLITVEMSSDKTTKVALPWNVEFKPFRDGGDGKKRPRRFTLRLAMAKGSWTKVLVQKDGGRWIEVSVLKEPGDADEFSGEIPDGNEKIHNVNIAPGRCDVFRVRLEGMGECRILSLTRGSVIGGAR